MSTDRLIWVTLCGTLWLATAGILALMACGKNVAAPVSLGVIAGWYKLLEAGRKRIP